jgi:hypothetical protein
MFFLHPIFLNRLLPMALIHKCRWLACLLLIACAAPAQGQMLGIGRKAQPGETPPKAMLIELLTRDNQRAYLIKNRPDLLSEFDRDVQAVIQRTVTDWSNNFSFCPVYFFLDTNADRIMRGEFAGVLLDSNLAPVEHPVVANGERHIYIGYYGSAMSQPDTVRENSPLTSAGQYMEHDGDDVTSLIRERFLVHNADFRMLGEDKPRTNYYRAFRPPNMTGREYRRYRRALVYNAKRWYIDYQPVAFSYDATLRRYFR